MQVSVSPPQVIKVDSNLYLVNVHSPEDNDQETRGHCQDDDNDKIRGVEPHVTTTCNTNCGRKLNYCILVVFYSKCYYDCGNWQEKTYKGK